MVESFPDNVITFATGPGSRDWPLTTLSALCDQAAARYGEKIYIEEGETALSYVGFNAIRHRVAKALIAAGIAKGDRVMIWAPNTWHWVAAAMGITSIGAVMVPVSTRFRSGEVADLVERSGARLIFSAGDFLGQHYPDMLTEAARARLDQVIVIGRSTGTDLDWDGFLATGDSVSDAALDALQAQVGEDDLCDMLFTSGTTGYPKGVKYAHQQCLQVVRTWAEQVGLRFDDRVLVISPFFHAFGYRAGAIVTLMMGAVLVPHQTFDAEEVLGRVHRDRISVIPGPPALFQSMLQHPELARFDTGSLRLGVTGGSVVPAVLIRRMREDLGFEGVCNGYGLTECGGFGAMCDANDPDEVIANTSGKPGPGVELRIMAEDGSAQPQGTPGEVALRGFLVMKGYFNDDAATRRTIDAEGWLHTGDVGYIDENGNLRIEDRMKDMYICGGFNCYPAEIERYLSRHPAVGHVAVIGVAEERLGEVGKAFVVLRPGTHATEAELIAWARQNIANYKVPRSVVFLKEMPVSPQGKVMKDKLRSQELA